MILDAQNTFSNLANGDAAAGMIVGDNPSPFYIDQGVGGLNFFAPGGGAYVAPWCIVRVQTSTASSGSGTVQAVLQDAPDSSTTSVPGGPGSWSDEILGPVTSVANSAANAFLLAQRILPSHARYMRIVYRVGTAVFQSGVFQSFLVLDQDVVDISMRKVGVYVTQTGQIQEAVGQGILAQ